MNTRIPFTSAAALVMTLLGCSNPPSTPDSPPANFYVMPMPPGNPPPVPPPDFSMELPLEPGPHRDEFKGHFCQLGKSCLALDPRPFEACLVGTKRCAEKITEPLLVGEQELEVRPALPENSIVTKP